MRYLIVGAGVIGSIYAHLLARAGGHVTVYARGARLEELRQRGLLVRTASGVERADVAVTGDLPHDGFDVVIVAVRHEQADAALAELAPTGHPTIVTLVNTPDVRAWGGILRPGRLVPAFPGAGGALVDGVLEGGLTPASLQRTTIGELDGRRTERLERVVASWRRAGIPVAVSGRIADWLLCHVALVVPIGNAIQRGDHTSRAGVLRCATELRAAFTAARRTGARVEPARYRVFTLLPPRLVAPVLRRVLASRAARQFLVPHALAARVEMDALEQAFDAVVGRG